MPILDLMKSIRWPHAAIIIASLVAGLIVTGIISVDQLRYGASDGFVAVLSGENEEKFQSYLAKTVEKSGLPHIEEVGLFLFINGTVNLEGRLDRNISEICTALMHATEQTSQSHLCTETYFATTSAAIRELDKLHYLDKSRYIRENIQNYRLNTLGQMAFASIYRKWTSSGGEKAAELSRLDLNFPGLWKKVIDSRKGYLDSIKQERTSVPQ